MSSLLIQDVVHQPNHHPLLKITAHAPPSLMSLSWSGVLNIIPLALFAPIAAPAMPFQPSPLYPATASRYLSASSLMEKVEYSDANHPYVRPSYTETQSLDDIPLYWNQNHISPYLLL